jgi:hypothetical protein
MVIPDIFPWFFLSRTAGIVKLKLKERIVDQSVERERCA